jgi:Alpha/beta hydrolase
MTGYAVALSVFRQVSLMAEDNARVLDGPLGMMADQAWVGGGAPTFTADFAARRRAMQGAWTQALESVAGLITKLGGPCVAPPAVATAVTAAAQDGPFAGINSAVMSGLITRLGGAGRALEGVAPSLLGELAGLGLDTGPARTVGAAGEWAVSQAGGLRRRLSLVLAADRAVGSWIPAQVAGFGLFAEFLPGLAGLGRVLDEAAAGNTGALRALLKDQSAGRNPDLAVAVNTWWQMLAASAQQRLIAQDAAMVGALDGVPAADRDKANRSVFSADYVKLTAQAAELGKQAALPPISLGLKVGYVPNPAAAQALQELAHINGLLNGMNAIKAQLGQPGKGQNGLPPVYLLGFDTQDLGHAIVSFGDPDTANNVVTYVPGFGSGFASTSSGDMTRASRLWRQATQFDPAAKTASIYWLGYSAPQVSGVLNPATSVATENVAKAAAPLLDSFAAGLAAAHTPDFAAHTVMLGHSYGSLVVGEAATRWPGTLADDLAFVGSPGVGVNKASDLGEPADDVFAGQAGGDPVPDLPPAIPLTEVERDPFVFGPVAAAQLVYGAVRNIAGDHDESHFGTNPATPQFGGRVISVPHGKYPMWTLQDHSSYWDPGSESLFNLAYIVDGQDSKVAYAPPGGSR